MNFLEQLVAEWYGYHKKCFVQTNVKFGRLRCGGFSGEMDVIAYQPETKEFFHIEASTDAFSREKRRDRFQQKFRKAEPFYSKLFLFPKSKIRQIALVGGPVSQRYIPNFGEVIEVKVVPLFMLEIAYMLRQQDPMQNAVPETYPLLRAIQYSLYYHSHLGWLKYFQEHGNTNTIKTSK